VPLVRIDLAKGKPAQYAKTVGEIVYEAMVEVLNAPKDDKFQVITEHPLPGLNFPPSYLGVTYSPDIIFIQITLNQGRTVELKKAFYNRIARDIHERLKTRTEDIIINLVEVTKENWSFGNGIATYAT